MAYPASKRSVQVDAAEACRSILPYKAVVRDGTKVVLRRAVLVAPTPSQPHASAEEEKSAPSKSAAPSASDASVIYLQLPPPELADTTSPSDITDPTLASLFALLNYEVDVRGDSYPTDHTLTFNEFVNYFMAYDTFIMTRWVDGDDSWVDQTPQPATPDSSSENSSASTSSSSADQSLELRLRAILKRSDEIKRLPIDVDPSSVTAALMKEEEEKEERGKEEASTASATTTTTKQDMLRLSSPDFIGAFYIKPNWPGRCSHVANCGYLVAPAHQSRGAGFIIAEVSRLLVRALRYDAMVFNLVFESNIGSNLLWIRLGFLNSGRIPAAGRLRVAAGGCGGRSGGDGDTASALTTSASAPVGSAKETLARKCAAKAIAGLERGAAEVRCLVAEFPGGADGTASLSDSSSYSSSSILIKPIYDYNGAFKAPDDAYVTAFQWHLNMRTPQATQRVPPPWLLKK